MSAWIYILRLKSHSLYIGLPGGPIVGSIRPAGSKSLTNRALVCAALAEGDSLLCGALDSGDTRVMATALQRLGLAVTVDLDRAQIAVAGCGGPSGPATTDTSSA